MRTSPWAPEERRKFVGFVSHELSADQHMLPNQEAPRKGWSDHARTDVIEPIGIGLRQEEAPLAAEGPIGRFWTSRMGRVFGLLDKWLGQNTHNGIALRQVAPIMRTDNLTRWNRKVASHGGYTDTAKKKTTDCCVSSIPEGESRTAGKKEFAVFVPKRTGVAQAYPRSGVSQRVDKR